MKRAFLFPGQGSQNVGMAKEFLEAYPESREVFDAASGALDSTWRRSARRALPRR
jgi:[acyl-carrier-protein] S-malonyltransferase